ncbi:MAG: OB-fold nucleic acid binding domain-containing protein, partial [Gemmatimonadaceae bacterium]
MSAEDLNFVLKARREKLERLRELGVEPFAYGYERTHSAGDAVAQLGEAAEAGPVRVAGRLVAWRGHGKTAFAHLADQSGRIQLYLRRDELGDERFLVLDQLDIGD